MSRSKTVGPRQILERGGCGLPLFPRLARIRGARLEVIERCGHLPPVECPEAFAHAVIRFPA